MALVTDVPVRQPAANDLVDDPDEIRVGSRLRVPIQG